MGIPQFHNEGVDQGAANTGAFTISFAAFTWSAGDIIEIVFATDGWVPVLTTANGFQLAADPQGNTAGITTNGGVVSTADCGIFVYWKRALGNSVTTDPPPVFQAPSVSSGTSWCLQPNSFSGARTTGTPYHAITTAIVTTATTAVTSVAATSKLVNCLFMGRVASSNDDAAFNNWTVTGSAGPSGSGAPNTGWHNSNGNACAFTGYEGGFAAATSNVTGTTTFAASTKQALVTLVMASVDEFELEEGTPAPAMPGAPMPVPSWISVGDELPVTTVVALDDGQLVALPLLTAPAALVSLPQADEIITSSALAIGVTAWREKANTTSPNTGTVTTLASYPAWPASTSEAIITDPRVTNAGNVYELATSGTTASSGGPTGTPAPVTNGAVTDNTAKWNWLTSGNGAANTQPSGSMFLVSSGQGSDTNSGTTPTDNQGNSYSKIGSTSFFAGFPQSSAASYVSALPATGGTGHTVSGTYGLGLDGGGDEKSLMFVEIIGGTTIVDHSQGEFSPNGSNVVTSASVTTTGPAILICFCWLNGGVHADGFLHTATPGSGFAQLPLASGLLEIGNTAGQVQGCTIWRQVSSAGTYSASITTGAGLSEGSVMHLIAVQGAAQPSIAVEDDQPAPLPGAVLIAPLLRLVPAPDEIMPTISVEDDAVVPRTLAVVGPPAAMPIAGDELAVAPGDDGAPLAAVAAGPLPAVAAAPGVDDDLPLVAVVDENGAAPTQLPVPAVQPSSRPDGEELPVITVDDDAALPGAPALTLAALALAPRVDLADEVPLPVILDEDGGRGSALVRPSILPVLVVQGDDIAVGAAALVDEDPGFAVATWPPAPVLPALAQVDELAVAASAFVDEDGAPLATPVQFAQLETAPAQADEILPTAIVDEDAPPAPPAPMPVALLSWPVQIDELIVSLAATLDEDSQIALLLASAAPLPQQLLQGDEVAPTALEDVSTPAASLPAPPALTLRLVPDDEFQGVFVPPPTSMVDEDAQAPQLPWSPPTPAFFLLVGDELAIPLAIPSLTKHVRVLNGDGPVAVIVNTEPTVIILENADV